MKKIAVMALGFALGALPAAAASAVRGEPWGEPGSTLEMAKRMEPDSYEAASARAEIEETADRRSFTVWKAPEGFDPKTGVTLVTLHGHAGWATRGFTVWEKEMKRRGWAHLGVQWWYGRSAEGHGYAKPNDIYKWILEALERRGVAPGRVIFEGYSMGSANSYAVTFNDRRNRTPYFAATISNSGPLEEDFPPNRAFLSEERPFAGTHWILYCSLRDQELKDACPDMRRTEETLKKLGGAVDLFIQDPDKPHGGFMQAPNLDRGLDAAEENLR